MSSLFSNTFQLINCKKVDIDRWGHHGTVSPCIGPDQSIRGIELNDLSEECYLVGDDLEVSSLHSSYVLDGISNINR